MFLSEAVFLQVSFMLSNGIWHALRGEEFDDYADRQGQEDREKVNGRSDYHQTGQIPGLVGSMKPESGGGPDQAPREIRLTFTIVKKKRTFKNTTASGALAPRNQSSPCS